MLAVWISEMEVLEGRIDGGFGLVLIVRRVGRYSRTLEEDLMAPIRQR